MAPLGNSLLNLKWSKSLGEENLVVEEFHLELKEQLRELSVSARNLPPLVPWDEGPSLYLLPCLPRIPRRQTHTQADSSVLADLSRAISWGLGQRFRAIKVLPGSLLLPSCCTGLTASWSQDGSLASGFWTQEVVGWPRQRETREENLPEARSAISFCLSPCPPPNGDHRSPPEIKELTPGTRREEGRPWASFQGHAHMEVWSTHSTPQPGPAHTPSKPQGLTEKPRSTRRPHGYHRGSPPGSNDITLLLSVVTELGWVARHLPCLSPPSRERAWRLPLGLWKGCLDTGCPPSLNLSFIISKTWQSQF